MTETIWSINDYRNASFEERLVRTVNEQIVPQEAANRVKTAGGKAELYYVYGIPKDGGKVITAGSDGINTVTSKVLLGTFETEEEAKSFQKALNDRIASANNG